MKAILNPLIVVAGGGGFICGHLVQRLLAEGGRTVRTVDRGPLEQCYQLSADAENLVLDLQNAEACDRAVTGASMVYNLAAGRGGHGVHRTSPGQEGQLFCD